MKTFVDCVAPCAAPRVAVLWAVCGLVAFLAGCGAKEPFQHSQVSGKVTYDDGTPIPIEGLTLMFLPQTGPIDPKTYPRPGSAVVDRATGAFRAATTHKANDGLVRGKHKVTLYAPNTRPLDPSVVPPEYCDPAKTPLEVDTAHQPFELKVRKPKL